MWTFWFRVFRRAPRLGKESLKRVRGFMGSVALLTVIAAYCIERSGSSVGTEMERYVQLPSSVPAVLVIGTFVYLLMRAVWEDVEARDKKHSEERQATERENEALARENADLKKLLSEKKATEADIDELSALIRLGVALRDKSFAGEVEFQAFKDQCDKWITTSHTWVADTFSPTDAATIFNAFVATTAWPKDARHGDHHHHLVCEMRTRVKGLEELRARLRGQ